MIEENNRLPRLPATACEYFTVTEPSVGVMQIESSLFKSQERKINRIKIKQPSMQWTKQPSMQWTKQTRGRGGKQIEPELPKKFYTTQELTT